METAEDQYKKELEEAGVDTTDLVPKEETPAEETPTKEVTVEEKKEEIVPTEQAPLTEEPKEQPKRSIYDDYKEKKQELKSEKELREQAEQERDALKQRLEALENADTPEEKQEAKDELEAFAKEINADPQAIRKMRDLFLKDYKPSVDPTITEKLEAFEKWQKDNAKVIEKTRFEGEFTSVLPSLNQLIPNASPEELTAIKVKVDEISHTKEFHDKDLDYVIFKNKDTLAKLVTPKKRGMESKERKDVAEESTDFDVNADYSKMSMKEREAWEANYNKLMSEKGIVKDANGKSLLI